MEITDLLQPQYFPFIMVFASGYIFIYVIFGKTRTWKELDSTLKVVFAIVGGFGVEFCIVLPFFYLANPSNITDFPIITPALEATWVYHWTLTGGVAAIFTLIKDREKVLRYGEKLVRLILLPLFLALSYLFVFLLVEYVRIYSVSVQISSPLFYYLPVNFIFSFLGMCFCLIFSIYVKRTHEEELIYGKGSYTFARRDFANPERERFRRRLFLFRISATNFWRSKKKYAVLIGIITVVM
jgi:hypothetical protein